MIPSASKPPALPAPQRAARAGAAALVLVLGLAAYARTFNVPYLFDDNPSILKNASLQHLGDLRAVLSPPRDTTVAGRPIANLTFALDYRISGFGLHAMHATNLAIHLLAGLVLLWLIRETLRLLGRDERTSNNLALTATLLWLLHPLQTESVTYVVQRVESLAALFLLITLAAALRWHTTRRPLWAVAAWLACAAGLATKETMVVAPVMLVLYDRAFLFDSLRDAWRERGTFYAALAALWIPFGWMIRQARGRSAGLHFGGFSPWLYLRYQARAIVHYLRLIFWPAGLTFDYGEPGRAVPPPYHMSDWLLPGTIVVLLLLLSLWAWRRSRAIGFLGTAFFVLLAPSSSVVPVVTEVVSEHRMYLALAPILILLVIAGERWLPRGKTIAAVAAVLILGLLTARRNETYRTRLSLWTDTVRKNPNNPRAWVELGAARIDAGDRSGGDAAYRAAIHIDAEYPSANFGLGISAAIRGDCPTAIRYDEIALKRQGKTAEIHYNLGACLAKLGRWNEAAEQDARGVELSPEDAGMRMNHAEALAHLGRADEAVSEAQRAIALRPDWAVGHYQYADVLILLKREDEARAQLENAVRLDPKLVLGHHRLALVDAGLGRWTAAIDQLEATLRIAPSRVGAMEDLAWLRATLPDASQRSAPEAVRWATRALALNPGGRRTLDVLAAALAEAGRFDEAIQTEQRALVSKPQGANRDAMNARLTLYRQHQAYREHPALP